MLKVFSVRNVSENYYIIDARAERSVNVFVDRLCIWEGRGGCFRAIISQHVTWRPPSSSLPSVREMNDNALLLHLYFSAKIGIQIVEDTLFPMRSFSASLDKLCGLSFNRSFRDITNLPMVCKLRSQFRKWVRVLCGISPNLSGVFQWTWTSLSRGTRPQRNTGTWRRDGTASTWRRRKKVYVIASDPVYSWDLIPPSYWPCISGSRSWWIVRTILRKG